MSFVFDLVFSDVYTEFPLDQFTAIFYDFLVEVFSAEVGVAFRSLHLEHAFVHHNYSDVKRTIT